MSGTTTAVIGFAAMLVLIGLRMPVGLAMLLTGSVGYVSFMGVAPFLSYMKTTPYHLFANYTLSVIPLFILMGRSPSDPGFRRTSSALPRACSDGARAASPSPSSALLPRSAPSAARPLPPPQRSPGQLSRS